MHCTLLVTSGPGIGQSFDLTTDCRIRFGRHESNDIVLAGDDGISRRHFEIVYKDGRYGICDLNSHNGTYLNRRPVSICDLNSGDEIRVGRTTMVVSIAESGPVNHLMQQAGVDRKSKVEFRFGDSDEPTVADSEFRISRLTPRQIHSPEFDAGFGELPGKCILLNSTGIGSKIETGVDSEMIGRQGMLVFPTTTQTVNALRERYFGSDTMIFLNHTCRRSRLVRKINASFEKFAHPSVLIGQFQELPPEAATALMNGLDLAICETGQADGVDAIHGAVHSNWLSGLGS